MYSDTTRDIRVTVEPRYLPEQSQPGESHYVWAYQVRIENLGRETVRLRTRYWKITDALGRLMEVRGPGVVGEQPVIEPGGSYAYASGCPLPTDSGSMVGAYYMTDAEGRSFEVEIPAFSLDTPGARRVLN